MSELFTNRNGSSHRGGVRLWPLLLIVLLVFASLAWIWGFSDSDRQSRVMTTVLVAVLATLAALLWLLVLSGLGWLTRLGVLAVLAGVGLGVSQTVRIVGVNGDLVPILEWSEAADTGSHGVDLTAALGEGRSRGGKQRYPQFLGIDRDAMVDGIQLETDWTRRPPTLLWHREVGEGWSGFAVDAGLAVTLQQRGPDEQVIALRLETGEPVWVHSDPARYSTLVAGTGPRSTPTIYEGRVYSMGATGILNCMDLESGRLVWQRYPFKENDGRLPGWGLSVSPLVYDDKVVVSTGGSHDRALVAYDRHTGDPIWQQGSGQLSYSSPQLREVLGGAQILMLNAGSLVGHDPETGKVLWEHPWPRRQENIAQPLQVAGDQILVSAGYGTGSKLFQVSRDGDRFGVEMVWETPRMKSKFSNLILYDGFVYGMDDGILACLDPETGKMLWKRGRFTHSQLMLVGDTLLIWTETSELILVDPHPEGLRELARVPVFQDKSWNPPALAGNMLLLRNHKEAVALELPVR